jgi:hypothetical protein
MLGVLRAPSWLIRVASLHPSVFKRLQVARLNNPRARLNLGSVLSIVGATLAEENERLSKELLDLHMFHGPIIFSKQ